MTDRQVLRGCPSFEMCCFFDGHHGARCWDAQAGYTYERRPGVKDEWTELNQRTEDVARWDEDVAFG